jgi:hypothetical protein
MERTCKKCGETKPIEEFVEDKKCILGHLHICKKCRHVHRKQSAKIVTFICIDCGQSFPLHTNRRLRCLPCKTNYLKKYKENYRKNHKHEIYIKQKSLFENYRDVHYRNCKKYRERNRDIILQKKRTRVQNITDQYVIDLISGSLHIPTTTIRQHPELIESYRLQIKSRRALKNKTNGTQG